LCRISGCTKPRPTQPLISFLFAPTTVNRHNQHGAPWCETARDKSKSQRGRVAAGGVGRFLRGRRWLRRVILAPGGAGDRRIGARWRIRPGEEAVEGEARPAAAATAADGRRPDGRSCVDGCGGCRRIQRSPPGEDKHGAELPAADPAWIGARGGRPRPARGRRHPGEFFTICCCSTTTAADQIDLPRHLEDRQILDLSWRGWRARPPAEIDISPGGR